MSAGDGAGERDWTDAERRLARRLARQERLARLLPPEDGLHEIERDLVAQALKAVPAGDVPRVVANYSEIAGAEEGGED